jgi:hypothetical protein
VQDFESCVWYIQYLEKEKVVEAIRECVLRRELAEKTKACVSALISLINQENSCSTEQLDVISRGSNGSWPQLDGRGEREDR